MLNRLQIRNTKLVFSNECKTISVGIPFDGLYQECCFFFKYRVYEIKNIKIKNYIKKRVPSQGVSTDMQP